MTGITLFRFAGAAGTRRRSPAQNLAAPRRYAAPCWRTSPTRLSRGMPPQPSGFIRVDRRSARAERDRDARHFHPGESFCSQPGEARRPQCRADFREFSEKWPDKLDPTVRLDWQSALLGRQDARRLRAHFQEIGDEDRLKTALCTMLAVTFVCGVCSAQIYDQNNSPSSQNWTNSPQNWRNSTDNWANSPQIWPE